MPVVSAAALARLTAPLEAGEVLPDEVVVVGRIVGAPRVISPKLRFVDVVAVGDDDDGEDGAGSVLQVCFNAKRAQPSVWATLAMVGAGDTLAVTGHPGRTRSGKLADGAGGTLFASAVRCNGVSGDPDSVLRVVDSVERGALPEAEAAELLSQLPLLATVRALARPELERRAAHSASTAAGEATMVAELAALEAEYAAAELTAERQAKLDAAAARRDADVVVVLQDVSNPANAAAILRTCDGLGIGEAIFVFEAWEPYADDDTRLFRASKSANRWVPQRQFRSTAECVAALSSEGFTSVATALHHDKPVALHNADFASSSRPKIALWVGTESTGLSDEALAAAEFAVYVPMRGMVESFNVSVAAAVVLSEVMRQRG